MGNTLKLAIMASAAAAALSAQTASMVWDSTGPSELPMHRRGRFKPNARKATKKNGRKGK